MRELKDSYWEQCLRVVEVLRHFDCLEGATLTPMGRLISSLRHDNELLVARVAFSGLFTGLAPAEAAALLACVVEEPRETETMFARQVLKKLPQLRRRVQALESLAAPTTLAGVIGPQPDATKPARIVPTIRPRYRRDIAVFLWSPSQNPCGTGLAAGLLSGFWDELLLLCLKAASPAFTIR